jgi:hypothetical protein
MTDISITAANCVPVSGATIKYGTAGETITAGQVVYLQDSSGKWLKADNNSATAEVRGSGGVWIALTGSSLNQPIAVGRGQITIGGTLTAGVAYYLSDTAGGICPVADLGSGEYSVLLGFATTTAILDVAPQYSGVPL